MVNANPPDSATRPALSAPEIDAVAAHCASAIDKLLALTNGGPSGELGPKSAASLAADIARTLEAEHARLAGR